MKIFKYLVIPLVIFVLVVDFVAVGSNSKKNTSLGETALTEGIDTENSTPSDVPANGQSDGKEIALVVKVIDGDTIELSDGRKVRLIGVDTPETVDPRKGVECYGNQASNFTKTQLLNKDVVLEKDISEADKYGRILRYIWLNDKLFNEVLVVEGYAQSYSYPPDIKYQDKILSAQEIAIKNREGLWGADCNQDQPTASPTTASEPIIDNQQYNSNSCKYSCSSPDRDCSDFSTHREAQNFFTCCKYTALNDPMKLDSVGVGNGIACESLP